MPLLRVGNDFGLGEAAHLVANGLERLVEAGVAVSRRALARLDQLDHAGARLGLCRRDQSADRRREESALAALADAKLAQPRRLALAHGDAAGELRQIFGGADPGEQTF